MAEKRMFAKSIIDTDAFLSMPLSTQALYFHLGMQARYNGILRNVSAICKYIGCSKEDIDILSKHKYIKQISDGVYQITDWEENNGIAETAKKRLSYRYRKWREEVLKRDHYTCQMCGAKNKVMNVHHIKPFCSFPNLRYELSNGITLCESCHRALHKKVRKCRKTNATTG